MKLLAVVAVALAAPSVLAGSCTKERAATVFTNALAETAQRGDCAGPAMEAVVGILTACTLEGVDISEFDDQEDELTNRCNKGGLPEGKKYRVTRIVPASEASLPECTSEQLTAAGTSKEQTAWDAACTSTPGTDADSQATKMCSSTCLDAWAKMIAIRPQCLLSGEDYRATGNQELEQLKNQCADFHPKASSANASAEITFPPSPSTSTATPVTTTPSPTTVAPATTVSASSSAVGLATASVAALVLAVATATAQL